MLRLAFLMFLGSVVSLRRKRKIMGRSGANNTDAHSEGYVIGQHKKITKAATDEWIRQFPSVLESLGHKFPEFLGVGAAWPDCPIMLEDYRHRLCVEPESMIDSCVAVPGAGDVGFHEGLQEMGLQLVKQSLPLLGRMREKERMGNNRMLIQHHHASPLPTTHLVIADANCTQECVDTLQGNCDQSRINPSAYFCHLPPFSTKFLGSDFVLSQVHARSHAPSTNVQLRNKLLEHSGKWYCKAMQHLATSMLAAKDYEAFPEPEVAPSDSHWHHDASNVAFPDTWLERNVRFVNNRTRRSSRGKHFDRDEVAGWWVEEAELGAHYLGRILHPLQDSFSRSHAERAYGDAEDFPEITQFFTMDDVDWSKHGSFDKIEDDASARAIAATSLILKEFGRWFMTLKIKLDIEYGRSRNPLDAPSFGGHTFFDTGLHRFLQKMCTVYKIRPEDLRAPAGGSGEHVSLSGRAWVPDAMPENLAREYRQMKEVFDYPPPDLDICSSPEVTHPGHYRGIYRHTTQTPGNNPLGGDGLGVGRNYDISLSCVGLGAASTITLQDVDYMEDPVAKAEGIDDSMIFKAKNKAHWKLYEDPPPDHPPVA